MKSSRCSGTNASSAASRACAESARTSRSTSDPPVTEEHVLGAAQPDALRAQPPRPRGVVGGVGVRPHLQAPRDVGVAEDRVDRPHQVRRLLVDVGDHGVEALLQVPGHR